MRRCLCSPFRVLYSHYYSTGRRSNPSGLQVFCKSPHLGIFNLNLYKTNNFVCIVHRELERLSRRPAGWLLCRSASTDLGMFRCGDEILCCSYSCAEGLFCVAILALQSSGTTLAWPNFVLCVYKRYLSSCDLYFLPGAWIQISGVFMGFAFLRFMSSKESPSYHENNTKSALLYMPAVIHITRTYLLMSLCPLLFFRRRLFQTLASRVH